MFSQIRKLWKSASVPLKQSQFLMGQSKMNPGQHYKSHLTILSSAQCNLRNFLPIRGTALYEKNTLTSVAPVTFHSIRTKVRVYYKGSAWKRYNKHNIEKRLTTAGGLEVLWRKVLKGRHQLAIYERILPNTVKGKILAEHQFRYKDHPLARKGLPKPGLF